MTGEPATIAEASKLSMMMLRVVCFGCGFVVGACASSGPNLSSPTVAPNRSAASSASVIPGTTAIIESTTPAPNSFVVGVTASVLADLGAVPFKLVADPTLVLNRGEQPTLTVRVPTTRPVLIVFGSAAPFTRRVTTNEGTLDVIGPFCPTTVDLSPSATIVCNADVAQLIAGTSKVVGPQPTGPTTYDSFNVTLRTDRLGAGHYEVREEAHWRVADNGTAREQPVELVLAFDITGTGAESSSSTRST